MTQHTQPTPQLLLLSTASVGVLGEGASLAASAAASDLSPTTPRRWRLRDPHAATPYPSRPSRPSRRVLDGSRSATACVASALASARASARTSASARASAPARASTCRSAAASSSGSTAAVPQPRCGPRPSRRLRRRAVQVRCCRGSLAAVADQRRQRARKPQRRRAADAFYS